MAHAHRLAGIGGEESSSHGNVFYMTSGGVQSRKTFYVKSICGSGIWKCAAPDLGTLLDFRKRKINHKPYAPKECLIERALAIGGENGQPAIGFHSLQQVADFNVCVTVMTVFDFTALAEQRIGFVEQQNRGAFFGGVKDAAQVLFRLANIFVDDLAEVDAIKIEPQFSGQDFSRHRLTGTAWPGEQRADSQTT